MDVSRRNETSSLAPLAPTLGYLSHRDEMLLDPLGLLQRAVETCGDIARLEIGPLTAHVLVSPDDLRHVLHHRQAKYPRNEVQPEHVKAVLGQGMLTANGENWRHQRQRAQPFFRPKRLRAYERMMLSCTDDLIDRWSEAARMGSVLDLHREMIGIALRISGLAFLGLDIQDDLDEVALLSAAFHDYGIIPKPRRTGDPLARPSALSLTESRKRLEAFIRRAIDRRTDRTDEGDDLLGMIIADYGGTEAAKVATQFHDEVSTLLMASHETTASALSFAFYLLVRHPEVMANLKNEAKTSLDQFKDGDGASQRLVYARMVVQESLRLYPPAWMIDRDCIEDDEVGGVRIPKGSLVFLIPYLTHRHTAYWPDPERFDPLRFAPDRIATRPRHAYIPFGTGPRVCIGASFALAAASIILSSVAAHFDIDLAIDDPVEVTANFTLRPGKPLPMTVRRSA